MRKGRELLGLETVLDKYDVVQTKLTRSARAPFFVGETITIHDPRNTEESQYYGNGTKWCTAAKNDNRFEYYFKDGPLYIIVPTKNSIQRRKVSDT